MNTGGALRVSIPRWYRYLVFWYLNFLNANPWRNEQASGRINFDASSNDCYSTPVICVKRASY